MIVDCFFLTQEKDKVSVPANKTVKPCLREIIFLASQRRHASQLKVHTESTALEPHSWKAQHNLAVCERLLQRDRTNQLSISMGYKTRLKELNCNKKDSNIREN